MEIQEESVARNSDASEIVMHVLLEMNSDAQEVVKLMNEAPIRVLGDRTIDKALADGDLEKVLRYLQTISGGQNG